MMSIDFATAGVAGSSGMCDRQRGDYQHPWPSVPIFDAGAAMHNAATRLLLHRAITCRLLSPPWPLRCAVRAWLGLRLKRLRCTSTPTRPAPFSWTPKSHRVIKPCTCLGSATLTVHFLLKCSRAVARPQQLVIGQQPVLALARQTSKI
jgi:hypothetical protein